jgi:hypothetical protein
MRLADFILSNVEPIVRNRNNLVAVIAGDNAAANAVMQQVWQGAVNQAGAAMKTVSENPAGYLEKYRRRQSSITLQAERRNLHRVCSLSDNASSNRLIDGRISELNAWLPKPFDDHWLSQLFKFLHKPKPRNWRRGILPYHDKTRLVADNNLALIRSEVEVITECALQPQAVPRLAFSWPCVVDLAALA